MATISKFYFHDAATPNTGTMPTAAIGLTGDASGATTARDSTDVIGSLQTSATITSNADQTGQSWGYRRFVSRPLAAQNINTGGWTFSYARSESNLNHNQAVTILISVWRPSSGATVWTFGNVNGTEPTSASTEQAESTSNTTGTLKAILDGDIMHFEIKDVFTQSMSTAYTSTFYYDGTTEASTTSCASFVTPPAPITLFVASTPSLVAPSRTSRNILLRR